MSVLASVIGSGAGAVVIALAVLLGKHYRRLPARSYAWVERAMIVLMYAGGSAVAVTAIGRWADGAVRWIAGLLGGVDTGLPHAALVITCMFVLGALLAELIADPSPRAAYRAAAMPLILALVGGGVLHQFYAFTTAPALALASSLNLLIGG